MKKINTLLLSLAALIIINTNSFSQQPQVTLKATNFVYTDSINGTDPLVSGIFDAMTFDIYLLVTGGADPFQYALGQYYFDLNVTNPDGTPATLLPSGIGSVQDSSAYKWRLVPGTTDFPAPYQISALPRNPGMFTNTATNLATSYPPGVSGSLGVITNSLRVNSNASLGGSPTFVISNVGNGTRVSTFRLKKKTGSLVNTHFRIQWRQNFSPYVTSASPTTKIFYYTPTGPSTEILFSNINYVIDTLTNASLYTELSNPANNSINNPTIIDFKWKKSVPAIKYRIKISTDSAFTGIFYDESEITDTSITLGGFNYLTKYYWNITASDNVNNTAVSPTWNFKIQEMPALKLKLTAISEGMYYPVFNRLSRRDTAIVELHQSISPYNIVATGKSVIDSISFKSFYSFPNVPAGTYYIVVNHFNSVAAWSKAGGELFNLTDTLNYNFTSSILNSYGNNLKLKGGKYCLYSGDLTGNGFIDGSDISLVENDAFFAIQGRYIPADLNADEIVDASDLNIVDANSDGSVYTIHP